MPNANRPNPESPQPPERDQGQPSSGDGADFEAQGDTYDPSPEEVNLAREQGLGVGQKDLDRQRDAT